MDEKKLKPAALNVLRYIINHGSITGQDAIAHLHQTELRSRISELRRAGFPIVSEYESGKNDFGGTVRYKRYRLEA
ncbi:MAG: hypothetical protein J6S60_00570 [Oscillospiraceae bacterium]|nr:hypothetical protein [Oscillospiraceae bacterium]